jgi:hypothetical protein
VTQEPIIEDGLVERLLAALADAMRRTRKDPFGAPVTVAEIYQDLVPYRSVRTALGFQMNADYEHTVLRLLAGEREMAKLEPEEAREELRSELEMPNPNVGLFRKFAACDVWILRTDLSLGEAEAAAVAESQKASKPPPPTVRKPPAEPEEPPKPPSDEPTYAARPAAAETAGGQKGGGRSAGVGASARPPEPPVLELDADAVVDEKDASELPDGDQLLWAEPEPPGEWDAAEGELLLEEEVQDQTEASDTSDQPASANARQTRQQPDTAVMFDSSQSQGNVATAKAAGSCAFCQGSLPGGRIVRFCPFCGADQSMKPCASCREPLEPSWKFCIGCGNEQS